MIAEFCQTQQPDCWTPPAKEILELRGLLSYRTHLVENRSRLKQLVSQVQASKELKKLHAKQLKTLDQSIVAVEKQLQMVVKAHRTMARLVEALTTVKGFGLISAASIVAKTPLQRLRNEKAVGSYLGLAPSERQSGTSVHGKPRICKTGNASLRRDLYMPAAVAMRYNPILKAFADRLKAKGKPPKVVLVAVMRKLAVLAFRIMKSTLRTLEPSVVLC